MNKERGYGALVGLVSVTLGLIAVAVFLGGYAVSSYDAEVSGQQAAALSAQ